MVPVGVGDGARRDGVLRTLAVRPEMKVVGAAIKIEIVIPNVVAIGFGHDAAIIAQGATFDPGGESDVSGDPETGTVGDLDVVVHSIEAQGIAAPTRGPSGAIRERSIVSVGGGIHHDQPAAFVELPVRNEVALSSCLDAGQRQKKYQPVPIIQNVNSAAA